MTRTFSLISILCLLGCSEEPEPAMMPESGGSGGVTAGSGGSSGTAGGAGMSAGSGGSTSGSGGAAGMQPNAMLSLIGPRRIALVRGMVCWLDSEGAMSCETPDGRSAVVPGEYAALTHDGIGIAAIRADGTAVHFGTLDPIAPDPQLDCAATMRCQEITPSRGKLVSISVDGSTGCGALDDGTVECWGGNAPTDMPGGSVVQVAYDGWNESVCVITRSGAARCGSSTYDIATGVVQIGFKHDELVALRSTGELHAASLFPGTALDLLPELRFFDAENVTGITLDGEIATADEQLKRIAPPAGPFIEVTTDQSEACALREDGSHVCWGGDWGKGLDTERCGLNRLGLRGTVAGEMIDYSERPTSENYFVNDNLWRMDANGRWDLFLLRSPDTLTSNLSSQYEPGATFGLEGSAFLISDQGNGPRVYCAGAGSTATKVDDELALDLENVTALDVCGDNPIEGEYDGCTDDGCEVTSTFEGQSVTSRVEYSEYSFANNVTGRVTVYEDGTVIHSTNSEARGYTFIFTPPDGPYGGNVYCSGNAGPDGANVQLAKIGTCVGSTSADALEGCIRN
jgi:hypothetical protein